MSIGRDEIDATLKILFSESDSLNLLGQLSTVPAHILFVGADFRGANLCGQDLSGFNFSNADFRSANLDNIKFDLGSLNNSLLDLQYNNYKDEFDLSFEEFLEFREPYDYYLLRVRLRKGFLDSFNVLRRMVYTSFASRAQIGLTPLRRARVGDTISGLTLARIVQGLKSIINDTSNIYPYLDEEARERDRSKLYFPSLVAMSPYLDRTIPRQDIIEFRERLIEHFANFIK